MIKYYSAVAVMCLIISIFSVLMSSSWHVLVPIYLVLGAIFLVIAVVTASFKSRW